MRDTVHVSLGASANAVTAHLLNLYGLAATQDDPLCDACVTHTTEHNYLVPRAFMVDEPTAYPASPEQYVLQQRERIAHANARPLQTATSTFRYHQPSDAFADFFQTSSVLAYSSQSRFHRPPSVRNTYSADPSNRRHVVWDDADEQEDEETDEQRQLRLNRQREQWHTHTAAPLQRQLDKHWNNVRQAELSWVDYLMPPYSRKLSLALPFSHQTSLVTHWDRYVSSPQLDRWTEDTLTESVRQQLEESDHCQGFVLTTQGNGIYANLATRVMQEMQEECRSAARLVYHITDPADTQQPADPGNGNGTDCQDNDHRTMNAIADPESSWQAQNARRVQSGIQAGAALHGLAQNAHVVLPLRIGQKDSLFASAARIALGLEAVTMPYRLNSADDQRYKIGLQNTNFFGQGGVDTRWGSTAQRLSFSEFIASLQPSTSYPLIELDVLDDTIDTDGLWNILTVGTSVEHDHRMRNDRSASARRQRDVAPGAWLNSAEHGGILSSVSSDSEYDREKHRHFALSSALRITPDFGNAAGIPQTLTCAVEGMGVRYRPERCISTVVSQSVMELTQGGYGVGAYWRSILKARPVPVVATISNTTRSHDMVDQVAAEMKSVLERKFRGFYNRGVENGVLPESEDCEEALAYCFDLRDTYTPPGLDEHDEGYDDL